MYLNTNKRGQALIETLITLPIATVLLIGMFLFVWRYTFSIYIQERLNQTLYCTTDKSIYYCKRKFESQTRPFVLIGKLDSFTLESKSNQRIARITWEGPKVFGYEQRQQFLAEKRQIN